MLNFKLIAFDMRTIADGEAPLTLTGLANRVKGGEAITVDDLRRAGVPIAPPLLQKMIEKGQIKGLLDEFAPKVEPRQPIKPNDSRKKGKNKPKIISSRPKLVYRSMIIAEELKDHIAEAVRYFHTKGFAGLKSIIRVKTLHYMIRNESLFTALVVSELISLGGYNEKTAMSFARQAAEEMDYLDAKAVKFTAALAAARQYDLVQTRRLAGEMAKIGFERKDFCSAVISEWRENFGLD